MKRRTGSLLLLCFFCVAFIDPPRKMKVYLIGDSTMSDKSMQAYPETGWGMIFTKFFDTATTVVYNLARNGRSTQSFLDEGRWAPVIDSLRDGDIVLIQFGHNDEVKTKKTYTTEEQFQRNLLKYVTEARSKKAIPILITPVARRAFDSTGHISGTHDIYSQLVRNVAQKNNVPLIELDKKSQAMIQSYGVENSKWLFNYLKPCEHPNYPRGMQDNTHFSELGARKVAEIVYADLKALNPGTIADHFFKPAPKKTPVNTK